MSDVTPYFGIVNMFVIPKLQNNRCTEYMIQKYLLSMFVPNSMCLVTVLYWLRQSAR